MPSKWVAPDVAHIHESDDGDVVVYHAYKNDEYNDVHTYWFRMDQAEQDELFDIRDWPGYEPKQTPIENVAAACAAGDIQPFFDDDEPEGFCGLLPRPRCKVKVTLDVTYVAPKGTELGSPDDVAYLLDAALRRRIGDGMLTDAQSHLLIEEYNISTDAQGR